MNNIRPRESGLRVNFQHRGSVGRARCGTLGQDNLLELVATVFSGISIHGAILALQHSGMARVAFKKQITRVISPTIERTTFVGIRFMPERPEPNISLTLKSLTISRRPDEQILGYHELPSLHLLEQVGKLSTHRQRFFAPPEHQRHVAEFVPLRMHDVLGIDHGATMNLPEHIRVELGQ